MSNLSHPTVPAIDAKRLAALRHQATSRLAGATPAAGSSTSSRHAVDALTVLHELASSPQTASDALTLLHELQVHQVELDLQAQELQESRAELESALRRQIALYHFQPAGLFTLDARRVVLEANQAGAALLDVAGDETVGRPLETYFSAESASRFRAAITRIDTGLPQVTCELRLRAKQGAERAVLASVGKDPVQAGYLVNLIAIGAAREDHPLAR